MLLMVMSRSQRLLLFAGTERLLLQLHRTSAKLLHAAKVLGIFHVQKARG